MDMYTQDPGRYQGLQGVPDWAAQGPDDLLRREMTGYSPDDMLGMYDRARQPEINPEYLQNFKANSGIDMVEAEMGNMRQLQWWIMRFNGKQFATNKYDAYGKLMNKKSFPKFLPSTLCTLTSY